MTRSRPDHDPPIDWRSTTVDRWSDGGPAMVRQWSAAVDRRWPPLTATVDRWSGGGSDDGDGTVPTPCGTTQVVTRGKLIVKIVGLDMWQVGIRGTRYYSFGYEVVVWQWRLRGTVAARDLSQSLGSSR
ncbi:hypothetical protein Tco_0177175, partial [Tanacetum coccineum]